MNIGGGVSKHKTQTDWRAQGMGMAKCKTKDKLRRNYQKKSETTKTQGKLQIKNLINNYMLLKGFLLSLYMTQCSAKTIEWSLLSLHNGNGLY